jgi:N-acetylglutamate synthase-like GNAT family acetyltransferase
VLWFKRTTVVFRNAYRFELQNSGVGKKLLQHAEIHAKDLGLPKIVMTVISVRDN